MVFLLGWIVETLSMKGLTLNCMDRKAEAYELVRLGLKVCMWLSCLLAVTWLALLVHEVILWLNAFLATE